MKSTTIIINQLRKDILNDFQESISTRLSKYRFLKPSAPDWKQAWLTYEMLYLDFKINPQIEGTIVIGKENYYIDFYVSWESFNENIPLKIEVLTTAMDLMEIFGEPNIFIIVSESNENVGSIYDLATDGCKLPAILELPEVGLHSTYITNDNLFTPISDMGVFLNFGYGDLLDV